MVSLRLSIEPASAAGCERRGTLVIQVGVYCLNRCMLGVPPRYGACQGSGSKRCGILPIQGERLLLNRPHLCVALA